MAVLARPRFVPDGDDDDDGAVSRRIHGDDTSTVCLTDSPRVFSDETHDFICSPPFSARSFSSLFLHIYIRLSRVLCIAGAGYAYALREHF